MFRLDKNRIIFFGSSLIFRLTLDISYLFVVSYAFAYEGYKLNYELNSYAFSWFFYIISCTFVSDKLFKLSDYFFATALLSVIAPLTSLYGLDSNRPLLPVFVVIFSIYFISLITKIKFITFENLHIIKDGRRVAIGISILFVTFLVVWYSFSGTRLNLDFSKIYDYRIENTEVSGQGFFAYTNNWTYQVFNIFLMAFSLFYRKYFWCAILFFVQVYFFSVSTHKTVLFLPFLLFVIWYYFKKTSSLSILPIMFSGVIVATLASYLLFDDLWLSSLFSRRVFYVPANLTFVYFEFFANNPKVFWSNSVLSSFISYPYNTSMTHVIGSYLGHYQMGANNGFVASGYAHAGFYGVFIYSLIVGIILRFLNDITCKSFPIWLAVALTIVPLRSLLISSDLFTVMLTHGFIVAIILIFLARIKHA